MKCFLNFNFLILLTIGLISCKESQETFYIDEKFNGLICVIYKNDNGIEKNIDREYYINGDSNIIIINKSDIKLGGVNSDFVFIGKNREELYRVRFSDLKNTSPKKIDFYNICNYSSKSIKNREVSYAIISISDNNSETYNESEVVQFTKKIHDTINLLYSPPLVGV